MLALILLRIMTVMFDLNEPLHVDVFIPVDEEGNQLLINPHEFPEDQQMDEDQLMADNEQELGPIQVEEPILENNWADC